jgi:hypothetical protein
MCRSIAQGGRRCAGRGGSASSGTGGSDTNTTPAATTETGTPSRARTDELAAALPADRTGWDGQPLNEWSRRQYALRESGYTGPIDQDGYPDTTSEGAGILRRMAQQRGETVTW